MVSSTSYLNVYRVASAPPCFNRASFVTCKRAAVIVPDLGCKGSILLCFRLVDPICYGWSLFIEDLV
jgi:hypothetical protein